MKDSKDNSLHLGRKYARIFVLGHYLFLVADSSCELRGTDNVAGENPSIFSRQMEGIVYATHTDRYLDFSSHHDKRPKISTAETLLHRATKLPSTSQGKNTEINQVTDALLVNNSPSYVISNILKGKLSKPPTRTIPTPEELVCMFLK